MCSLSQGRKLYYISAEFLIGKLLSNNLINLGLYDEARDALAAAGQEPCQTLRKSSRSRLWATAVWAVWPPASSTRWPRWTCPATAWACGITSACSTSPLKTASRTSSPTRGSPPTAGPKRPTSPIRCELAGKEYTARLYKLAVTGYEGRTNTLNLFDLDTIDESIVHDGIAFDKTAIDKNLTLFLYPDDSDEAGRRLRVYQQYLMVSAGAQLILAECAARGCDYHDLADYAAIQINDTHPSMVIPELIRLLGEKGIEFDEAVEIVTKTCAYTNHTILAEALEKWPRAYLDAVVPQLMPIIEKLDDAGPHPHRGREPCHHRQGRPGAHGTHGYPLHPLHQRRGGSAHRDFEKLRAARFLRAVPGKVQQQDQRHHLPPLAAGMRPGPDR